MIWRLNFNWVMSSESLSKLSALSMNGLNLIILILVSDGQWWEQRYNRQWFFTMSFNECPVSICEHAHSHLFWRFVMKFRFRKTSDFYCQQLKYDATEKSWSDKKWKYFLEDFNYTGCLYVDGVIKFTTMATILIVNRQNQKMPFLLEIACNGYEAWPQNDLWWWYE